jgi:23S rRNA (guanosine2251-2'-O)-methyltransferase
MKRELAMGINAVDGLLDAAPEQIVRVWIRPNNGRLQALLERLVALGVSCEQVELAALDRRARGVRHQGVIAEFNARQAIDENALMALVEGAEASPRLLILDGVQDPHNLGACLRSALAAGCCAVVVPKDRAAGLTPVTRRAAAGAAEQLPVAMVTNLARCMARLSRAGLTLVGLAGDGERSLHDIDLSGPLALVLGSEERGLRRLTREHCDQLARIDMPGPMESLNVSVAAGIALFEAVRQDHLVSVSSQPTHRPGETA